MPQLKHGHTLVSFQLPYKLKKKLDAEVWRRKKHHRQTMADFIIAAIERELEAARNGTEEQA